MLWARRRGAPPVITLGNHHVRATGPDSPQDRHLPTDPTRAADCTWSVSYTRPPAAHPAGDAVRQCDTYRRTASYNR
ncbi:hypothetical protein QF026_000293 [Streptomyces aurantiacus]|nr:hypothetical protein [Streptomyces aurantiacus]